MQAHSHKPPVDAYKTEDNIVEDFEDVLYWRQEEQRKILNSPTSDNQCTTLLSWHKSRGTHGHV